MESCKSYNNDNVNNENPDPRLLIKKPEKWPYCFIVRVHTTLSQEFHGTGVLVGSDIVLTAAHYIDPYRQLKDDIDPRNTTFSPSYKEHPATETYKCKTVYIPPKYYEDQISEQHDWAILVLMDNAGNKIKSECDAVDWPTCKEYDDNKILTLVISIIGFPGEYGGNELRKTDGYISQILSKRFSYPLTTSAGQGGGPIYVQDGNQVFVVGIHQKGGDTIGFIDMNSTQVPICKENWGVRITAEILDKIEELQKKLVLGEADKETEDTIIVSSIENMEKVMKNYKFSSVVVTKEWITLESHLLPALNLFRDHRVSKIKFSQLILSDEELETLAKGLSKLESLTSIDLNVQGKISDQGVKELSNALSNLKQLNHLQLQFSSCDEISDQGIKELSNALSNLKQLNHLQLQFSSCEGISDQGHQLLKQLNSRSLQDFQANQTIS